MCTQLTQPTPPSARAVHPKVHPRPTRQSSCCTITSLLENPSHKPVSCLGIDSSRAETPRKNLTMGVAHHGRPSLTLPRSRTPLLQLVAHTYIKPTLNEFYFTQTPQTSTLTTSLPLSHPLYHPALKPNSTTSEHRHHLSPSQFRRHTDPPSRTTNPPPPAKNNRGKKPPPSIPVN